MRRIKIGDKVKIESNRISGIVRTALTEKRAYTVGVVAQVGGTKREPRIAVSWPDVDAALFWFNRDQLEVVTG